MSAYIYNILFAMVCYPQSMEGIYGVSKKYKRNDGVKKDGEPSFRDKKNGWLDLSMRFMFEDGSEYNVGHRHDFI